MKARNNYLKTSIENAKDVKALYRCVNEATGYKEEKIFPTTTELSSTTDGFAQFYNEKILTIRQKIQCSFQNN